MWYLYLEALDMQVKQYILYISHVKVSTLIHNLKKKHCYILVQLLTDCSVDLRKYKR